MFLLTTLQLLRHVLFRSLNGLCAGGSGHVDTARDTPSAGN
jgi:hypothetical protein